MRKVLRIFSVGAAVIALFILFFFCCFSTVTATHAASHLTPTDEFEDYTEEVAANQEKIDKAFFTNTPFYMNADVDVFLNPENKTHFMIEANLSWIENPSARLHDWIFVKPTSGSIGLLRAECMLSANQTVDGKVSPFVETSELRTNYGLDCFVLDLGQKNKLSQISVKLKMCYEVLENAYVNIHYIHEKKNTGSSLKFDNSFKVKNNSAFDQFATSTINLRPNGHAFFEPRYAADYAPDLSNRTDRLSGAAIAGIVIGSLALAGLIGVGGFCIFRKVKTYKKKSA